MAIRQNRTAYVTSQRDHEVDVVDISGPPKLVARIKLAGTPNRMVLNRPQSQLFVASDNTDTVTIIDTTTNRISEVIDASEPPGLFAGSTHFRGAAPDGLTLSPDEQTLYVTLGGENALAIIPLSGRAPHHVAGLVSTGWYPNSVSAERDMLYVVNGRSDPGPNPTGCTGNKFDPSRALACRAANRYILQLSHASFLALPAPRAADLGQLTGIVAANNGYRLRTDPADER